MSDLPADWTASRFPIRQRTPKQAKPARKFFRGCANCNADFIDLSPGKTGKRGLWQEWSWYCSMECSPESLRTVANRELSIDPKESKS